MPYYQGLTECEMLAVHSEVKALQQLHGLSYKDAAHCLYHGEVKKLNGIDDAYHSLLKMHQDIDKLIMEDVDDKIAKIDLAIKRGDRS